MTDLDRLGSRSTGDSNIMRSVMAKQGGGAGDRRVSAEG